MGGKTSLLRVELLQRDSWGWVTQMVTAHFATFPLANLPCVGCCDVPANQKKKAARIITKIETRLRRQWYHEHTFPNQNQKCMFENHEERKDQPWQWKFQCNLHAFTLNPTASQHCIWTWCVAQSGALVHFKIGTKIQINASRFLCLHNNSTAYDALLNENVRQGHFLSQLWFNIEEWNCILERTIWLSKSHFLEGSVRLIFLEIQIFLYPSELLCKCTNF